MCPLSCLTKTTLQWGPPHVASRPGTNLHQVPQCQSFQALSEAAFHLGHALSSCPGCHPLSVPSHLTHILKQAENCFQSMQLTSCLLCRAKAKRPLGTGAAEMEEPILGLDQKAEDTPRAKTPAVEDRPMGRSSPSA